jgi:transposase
MRFSLFNKLVAQLVGQAASASEILATLREGRHTNPRQAAASIVEELRRPQLVANAVIVRTKSRLMLSLAKQLLVVIEEITGYEKEIRTLFLTHQDHEIWSSLPRAGQHLAPRLLAEWGDDRTRYADANSVQELAGTAPVPFQSGNYAKAHKRFACVKPWRNDLYQFAWQSTDAVSYGPLRITNENWRKAKRTVWLCALWQTSGSALCIACG